MIPKKNSQIEERVQRVLFNNNTDIKNLSVKTNLKEEAKRTTKRKTHTNPFTRSSSRKNKETNKNSYLGRATEKTEHCSVSPAVITVKNDNSVKIALDSRKLNEAKIKKKIQMPNMEDYHDQEFHA